MLNRKMKQPVTWQWLQRELASQLRASAGKSNQAGKPLAELLDEKLRQGESVKQSALKAIMGQK